MADIMAELSRQYERYRGSGTRMEKVLKEAAAEIERLREAIRRLAEQDATLSVCDGNVTVTQDASLTDAEREAIAVCIEDIRFEDVRATLRGLLERTDKQSLTVPERA
jgi:hypothetical protein